MKLYAEEGRLGSKDEIGDRIKTAFYHFYCLINPLNENTGSNYLLSFIYVFFLTIIWVIVNESGRINPFLVVVDIIALTQISFFFLIWILRKLEENGSKLIYGG